MFGDHGLCGLLEEGAHEKFPKCLGGNLGDLGGILQRSRPLSSNLENSMCAFCTHPSTKNERYFIVHFLLSMFSFKGVSVDIKDSTFSFGCYD